MRLIEIQTQRNPVAGWLMIVFGVMVALAVGAFLALLGLIGLIAAGIGTLIKGIGGLLAGGPDSPAAQRGDQAAPPPPPSHGTIEMHQDAEGRWKQS